MLEDNEPSLQKIDDYHKPMPAQKKQLLIKIAFIIGGGILAYIIVGLISGQLT